MNKPTVCSKGHSGKLRLLALAMSTALVTTSALAATLDDVVYTTLPGNQQQITFKLSESVGDPKTFAIDEPARIAIDLLALLTPLKSELCQSASVTSKVSI